MNSEKVKQMAIAIIPSFILAFGAYFIIGMSQGMQGINSMSPLVYWVAFVVFVLLLAFLEDGQLIISRSMKYFAYICWLSPVFAVVYTFVSAAGVVKSDDSSLSNAGTAVGVGIGGFIIVFIALVVGGLLGLVFFLSGNSIYKNRKAKLAEKAKVSTGSTGVSNDAPLA
jgi:hypothetical protein